MCNYLNLMFLLAELLLPCFAKPPMAPSKSAHTRASRGFWLTGLRVSVSLPSTLSIHISLQAVKWKVPGIPLQKLPPNLLVCFAPLISDETLLTNVACGILSGVVSSSIANPTDVLKVCQHACLGLFSTPRSEPPSGSDSFLNP